ncbi:MAG: M6 family metalloprotease domain-containing protein, partial [Oleibacter sp.]|nr:M6 family metalloprotease domain-containing protein [Thalassolituus sp.]
MSRCFLNVFVSAIACLTVYSSAISSVHAAVVPAVKQSQITLQDGRTLSVTIAGKRGQSYLQTDDNQILVDRNQALMIVQKNVDGSLEITEDVFGYLPGYDASAIAGESTSDSDTGDTQGWSGTNGAEQAPTAVNETNMATAPSRKPVRYTGGQFEQPVVVVRVSFSNQSFSYSADEVSQRLFASTDSVADFYLENSYQQFRIVPAAETSGTRNDGIIQITLDSAHPDFGSSYGSASNALVKSAFAALPNFMNLPAYDSNGDGWLDSSELGVVVLVAGYEQAFAADATPHPRIWAHKSSVSATAVGGVWISNYAMFGERHNDHLATVGLIAHELGHLLLDLPDLYDSVGYGKNIDEWGLMSYGIWNSSGQFAGDRPAHMVSWAKEFVGFAHADDHSRGAVTLSSSSSKADMLRIDLDPYRHGQRIMIEHRFPQGYDAGLST